MVIHLPLVQERVHQGLHQYQLTHLVPRVVPPLLPRPAIVRNLIGVPPLKNAFRDRLVVPFVPRVGLLHNAPLLE